MYTYTKTGAFGLRGYLSCRCNAHIEKSSKLEVTLHLKAGWHVGTAAGERERGGRELDRLLQVQLSGCVLYVLHFDTLHLVPRAAPITWVGELDEEVVAEGERFPLFLADWTAAVRAGAGRCCGGAWAADAGERARSRARSRPAGGGDVTCGLGRLDTSGGVLEAARMPFFFWRTLAMVCATRFAVCCVWRNVLVGRSRKAGVPTKNMIDGASFLGSSALHR